MASELKREQFTNAGINLWNSRCVKLKLYGPIDDSQEMGFALLDKGKDTESLVGMDLAIDLLMERQKVAALESQLSQACEDLAEANRKLDLLSDPAAVHTNILRGNLPITKAQLIHAAGLPADIEAQLAASLRLAQWTPITERLPEKSYAHNWLVWVKCDNKVGGYVDLAAYGDYVYEDEDADHNDPRYIGNEDDPDSDEGNMRGTGWHREEETHGGQYDTVMIDLNGKVTHWMPKPSSPIAPPAEAEQ